MKIKTYINTMIALKRFVFIAVFAQLSFLSNAQNKYALLIGINDYYEVPGVKSKESLNGAVNDAIAIRDLLINRFGFDRKNIDTIFNASATRDNIIKGLTKKLSQCKAGDMMVFYYSGHGVWMQNTQLKKDTVKRGMNQAMLTSDLYNYRDHFKCFLRDFTLKTYFNDFIDKKVVLTSIFDCCYSENLVMANREPDETLLKTKSIELNDLMASLTQNTEDPQQVIDSISEISATTPAGCQTDAAGNILDKSDSDMDGVWDCKDKEKFTDPECMPVNADGVGKCAFEYLLQKTLNKYDAGEIQKNNTTTSGIAARSFNPATILNISEIDTIARPSDRKNSKFLFMSATQDWQKALEFKNEDKIVHGMFTSSILRVFKKYPSNISVEELFEKIKQDMDTFHKEQNPSLYSDPARLKYDLIGTKIKK